MFDDPKHLVSLLTKLVIGKILVDVPDQDGQQQYENGDDDQFGQGIKECKFGVKLHCLRIDLYSVSQSANGFEPIGRGKNI